MIADQDKNLASAAIRVFGSWYDALVAAGIPVGERPTSRKKWSREVVIQEFVKRHLQGEKTTNVKQIPCDLLMASRRYFSGWRVALAAAGVAPGKEDR